MLAVIVPLREANTIKKLLINTDNLNKYYSVKKMKNFVIFPINKLFKTQYRIADIKLTKRQHFGLTIRGRLKTKLSKKELRRLKTAFDVVGDIAILEIDECMRKKEKVIADAMLAIHKNIKVVVRKEGAHSGIFRVQKLKWLAGEKRKETFHKENSIRLKLNPEKVYFSPRLGTERKRIADMVKKGEDVLVMFSGCGPYPLVIAKNSGAKSVVGIEINSYGHKYAIKNAAINKLTNVGFINGDVRKIIPCLKKKFDRIVMPLPKHAGSFLYLALMAAKKNAIVHFYDFLHEDHFEDAKDKIRNACKTAGKKCKIIRVVKCGQHKPYVYRVCVDFMVF